MFKRTGLNKTCLNAEGDTPFSAFPKGLISTRPKLVILQSLEAKRRMRWFFSNFSNKLFKNQI